MATNTLLTPSIITKETLVILENNLVAAGKVNRQFENQFVKIGTTLTIRKPNRFKVVKGPALQIQDITEPSTSISISNQAHVDFQFSSQELTLTIEEFSERYCKPAAVELANTVDYDVLTNFDQVFNLVGTPGTVPNTFAASVMLVGTRMDQGSVPQDGRVLVLEPVSYWQLANGLIGLYVKSVAEPALKGFLAAIGNFEIYEDQNIQSQTVGAYAGSGVVTSGQTGSSINTTGWSTGITGLLNVGDVLTFGGYFAVNPKNRQSTGVLQNFVVTATANSDVSGNSTISIYPAITTSGAYQTVSIAGGASGAITVLTGAASSTHFNNLAWVRDCFGLVIVPMEIPGGVDFAAREMWKNISMRIVRAFDIWNDVMPTRIDVLYGTATYYPELGVRLTS